MSKDNQPDPFLMVKIQEIKARPIWSMADLAIITGMPPSSIRVQMERTPLDGAFTIGRRISFTQDAALSWFEKLQREAAYSPRQNNSQK
jgi:hypothetical protein